MALTAKEKRLVRFLISKRFPRQVQKQVVSEMERVNALSDEAVRSELLAYQTSELSKVSMELASVNEFNAELNAVTITPTGA